MVRRRWPVAPPGGRVAWCTQYARIINISRFCLLAIARGIYAFNGIYRVFFLQNVPCENTTFSAPLVLCMCRTTIEFLHETKNSFPFPDNDIICRVKTKKKKKNRVRRRAVRNKYFIVAVDPGSIGVRWEREREMSTNAAASVRWYALAPCAIARPLPPRSFTSPVQMPFMQKRDVRASLAAVPAEGTVRFPTGVPVNIIT